MKTTTQIIRETLKHYNSGNRAEVNGSCKYVTPEGNKCALGRCFTEEGIDRFATFQGDVHTLIEKHNLTCHTFDEYLRPEYRGHSPLFWKRLQALHDNPFNWDADGFAKDDHTLIYIFDHFYDPMEPIQVTLEELSDFIKTLPEDEEITMWTGENTSDFAGCIMVKYGRSKGWNFTCCDPSITHSTTWEWIRESVDGKTTIAVLECSPFQLFDLEPTKALHVGDWTKTLKPEYK